MGGEPGRAGPDVLAAVRDDIRNRLDRLAPAVDEAERLRATLAALLDAPPQPMTPPRAPRGARHARLLTAVREHPGATPRELAALMGVAPAALYGPVRRAVLRGQIVKRDGRLHPVGTTTPLDPSP